MKFKDLLKNNPFTIAMIVISTLISGITFVFSKTIAIIELAVLLILVICALKWISQISNRKKAFLRSIEKSITEAGEMGEFTGSFPFPLLLIKKTGEIEWFNSAFDEIIHFAGDTYSDNILSFIPQCDKLLSGETKSFEYISEDTQYTVYSSVIEENLLGLYFVDDSELKNIRHSFNLTRPVVLLFNIDSLEQTEDSFDHADYYTVVSEVEREITKWIVENKCVFRKFADGKFMAITESANYDSMVKDNFSLLDKIRIYKFGNHEVDITLSVGVGKEKTFCESENSARQALDMARGRGGDQVVVKNNDNYEFFGGINSRKEKRGKIKSRILSSSLCEYIDKCSAVFIMGHTYSDFDAIGAAVGVSVIAKARSKNAYIVMNRKTSLAMPLVKHIEKENCGITVISPEKANEMISEDALLVVVDTMRMQLVEAPRLLNIAKHTVLIDHHRKPVDYIHSASLEFHEPYASSTCEMVTELIQYVPGGTKLLACEAEALLAGIILDTKNYTLRVGVRTFEAAAFLKDCKADTVKVKKFFAGSVEENIGVSRIISAAVFYDRFAVAVAPADQNVTRLISSKAADELLNIDDVDASFVLYSYNNNVNISARSLGLVNVQIIMEQFGGGGHQSMAACQINNCTINVALEKLKTVLSEYLSNNK